MHILAIETSGPLGSIALLADDRCLALQAFELGRQHGQVLIPELHRLLAGQGLSVGQCDLFAVSIGPGSYTGLRVGVACAKTLAWSVRKPLVAVETLAAVAAAVPGPFERLWVLADAQRESVYLGTYSRSQDAEPPQPLAGVTIVPVAELRTHVTAEHVLSGPALDRTDWFADLPCRQVDPELRHPRADLIGRLGIAEFHSGRLADPASLAPLYLRPSSAETQWDRLHGGRR